MKTIKISDETHAKLTALLGKLMAETGKPKTYQDTLEELLNQSVLLPQQVLIQIEDVIQKNKQLNYKTTRDFIMDAVNSKINALASHREQSLSHSS